MKKEEEEKLSKLLDNLEERSAQLGFEVEILKEMVSNKYEHDRRNKFSIVK